MLKFTLLFNLDETGENKSKAKPPRNRRLVLESLERREMLSVSTADFNTIKANYAELGLTNFTDYTIHEVGGTTQGAGQQLYTSSAASLQQAINEAPASKTLIVVRTTAGASIAQNTIKLAGAELAINNKNVTIVSLSNTGNTDTPLIINGDQGSRVFNIGSTSTVALAGLTITGGRNRMAFGYGGGIYNSGTLMVTDCTIKGNSTMFFGYGGGIYNFGKLTVTDSVISENTMTAGGGIANDGTATVKNSTIKGNTALGNGGGIFNTGTLTVTGGSIIKENTSTADSAKSGTSRTGGGGIFNSGTAMIESSTIANNQVPTGDERYGGGILNTESGRLTVTSSYIVGNYANRGGGIGNIGTDNARMTITNSVIAGNRATARGGGIWTWNTTTITNCTIAGNRAEYGSGIYTYAKTTTLYNTIVSMNTGSNDVRQEGGTITGTNNYIHSQTNLSSSFRNNSTNIIEALLIHLL